MKQQINSYNFEKISSVMTKNFGVIQKGGEELYNFMLKPIETNLLKINRINRINNGRTVIEAIKICLFTIDGYLTKKEYDLDKYINEKNTLFVNAILAAFDPFTSGEVLKIAEQEIDINSVEDLPKYFGVFVRCLLRIEKSIELWLKELGTNGYFNFLEDQIGRTVPRDDKMDFVRDIKRVLTVK